MSQNPYDPQSGQGQQPGAWETPLPGSNQPGQGIPQYRSPQGQGYPQQPAGYQGYQQPGAYPDPNYGQALGGPAYFGGMDPQAAETAKQLKQAKTQSILATVFGALSIFVLPFGFGIAGIVLGITALTRLKEPRARGIKATGLFSMGILGIVLGALGILAWFAARSAGLL